MPVHMKLFGLSGRMCPNVPETGSDSRVKRRKAREAAAEQRKKERAARRAVAAGRAEVEAFVRYLEWQGSLSYRGEPWVVAQREDHQEDARYIVRFYREGLAKHGPKARAGSLPELLDLVSPAHQESGVDRARVQYWISHYEDAQRSEHRGRW